MLTFLELGLRHILDPGAYDHVLFLLALCANYRWREWRLMAWLATAFTVGHSLTLALSIFDVNLLPASWVEFFIPVTIFITALLNLFLGGKTHRHRGRYLLAGGFGLIHGMGFSGYLSQLLGDGDRLVPLVGFNLGVELGQLAFISAIILLNFALISWKENAQNLWSKSINMLALTVSIHLALQQWPI